MKKYYTLGELLLEYREIHNLSQSDFAIKLNADIRTIQRWEKDVTYIKEEKVADLVTATLFPFQLIRNLNANDTIPTYYDFHTQKYSLSKLTLEVPDAPWFKRKMNERTNRIRTIDIDYDFDYLMTYMGITKSLHKNLYKLIDEASKICPELNLIITDDLGYYAGYCIVLSVSDAAYQKIRSRSLKMEDIKVEDLVNYKFQKKPFFINYNLRADCNENIQYLVGRVLYFFKNSEIKDYAYARYENRDDADFISKQIGLKEVWVDEKKGNHKIAMHFSEGNLNAFLKE